MTHVCVAGIAIRVLPNEALPAVRMPLRLPRHHLFHACNGQRAGWLQHGAGVVETVLDRGADLTQKEESTRPIRPLRAERNNGIMLCVSGLRDNVIYNPAVLKMGSYLVV